MVNTHLVIPTEAYNVQYSFIGYESIQEVPVTIKDGITITLSKALGASFSWAGGSCYNHGAGSKRNRLANGSNAVEIKNRVLAHRIVEELSDVATAVTKTEVQNETGISL
jgi:hypothetical protein